MHKHDTGMEDNEDSLADAYEQGLYNYMEIAKTFIESDCTLEDLNELDKVLKEVLDEYFSKEV
tara:strand:+ start:286 stop:474 length:189 start_codon:yes stop_codon:yes gene_type:complete